jgi:hypothetical protein
MPGGAGSVLTTAMPANSPPGKAPRDQEAPGSIALLHTTQHATTRPYLPCQHLPRRPGRSRCTRPQTPSAMSSLSN